MSCQNDLVFYGEKEQVKTGLFPLFSMGLVTTGRQIRLLDIRQQTIFISRQIIVHQFQDQNISVSIMRPDVNRINGVECENVFPRLCLWRVSNIYVKNNIRTSKVDSDFNCARWHFGQPCAWNVTCSLRISFNMSNLTLQSAGLGENQSASSKKKRKKKEKEVERLHCSTLYYEIR